MASAFSHALVALLPRAPFARLTGRVLLLGVICSILPDADVIAFRFGIPYEHVFGHRGITHSLFFAAVLALLLVVLFFRGARAPSGRFGRLGLWLYFFFACASHGLLDAATDGGLGVAFFAPFDNSRYFFPYRPIAVSPVTIGAFFGEWGRRVMLSEFKFVWLPGLTFAGLALALRMLIPRPPSPETGAPVRRKRGA